MKRALTRSRVAIALSAAMLISLLAVPAIGAPPGASSDDEGGYLIVELSSAPLAHNDATKSNGRFDPDSRAYRQAMDRLEAEHQRFIDRLAKVAPKAEVVREMFLTANAVTIELNGASLSDVSKVPGVQKTHEPALYQLDMNESVGLIDVDDFWADGLTASRADAGSGVQVGIIDSGINPDHPFFSCKDVHFGGVFYSGVGILPSIPALPAIFGPGFIPAPDYPGVGSEFYSSDPHGTHVAGTVGGCITTVDSGLFNGIELSGVAPGAELWDYNVFPFFGAGMVAYGGSAFSHDIAAAIEQAVADGMDVINMSLGGGVQGPNDFLAEVSNAAVDAGVVVVTSAGNEGSDPYTVGSPGSAENVITVGASTNRRTAGVIIDSSEELFEDIHASPGEFPDFDGSEYEIVDWTGADNKACDRSDVADDAHDGAVVLISRGSCDFSQKVENAKTTGAAGAIIYNNVEGIILMAASDGFDDDLPAVSVTQADGATMVGLAPFDATISPPKIVPTEPNLMADFSSRGPTPFTSIVKPDVVAPGVDILSSVWGFGGPLFGFAFGDPGWELYSGTSMASPHVAGAAAALLGEEGLAPAEVKSRFVNTGTVLDGYSVWDQGGGLVSLTEAHAATTTFDPASASFGGWQGNRPVSASVDIAISGQACSVNDVTGGEGAEFVDAVVSGDTLTVSFEGGREAPSGMHGGHVLLTCGGLEYDVPWGVVINR